MASPKTLLSSQAENHRLHKNRTEEQTRSPSFDLPEGLRQGDDDSREELMAPSQHHSQSIMFGMNQSIFGLIAAAGSRLDFNDRFEGDSSDSESDDGKDASPSHHTQVDLGYFTEPESTSEPGSSVGPDTHITLGTHSRRPGFVARLAHSIHSDSTTSTHQVPHHGHHRLKLPDPKLLRSIPTLLKHKSSKSKSDQPGLDQDGTGRAPAADALAADEPLDAASASAVDSSTVSLPDAVAAGEPSLKRDIALLSGTSKTTLGGSDAAPEQLAVSKLHMPPPREGRVAPVVNPILKARAQITASPSFGLDSDETTDPAPIRDPIPIRAVHPDDLGEDGMSQLARRLMEIFEFPEPEDVINEYPCWLLQSLLLQGFMYITTRHLCFYAYLPKRAEVVKTGYLSKSGKRNPRYSRFWFRLKGDILAYYRDPSNLYFPSGQVDLRYSISAAITDKDRDGTHFSVTTHHRVYHFRADSAPSAQEWVKSLQRVIFRSHNDGDSVKISLPIMNIIDIEETQMVEYAETCKIRVIDNDETYAIDEYFFTFFTSGKQAIKLLKNLIEDAQSKIASAPNTGVTDTLSGSFSPHRLGSGRSLVLQPLRTEKRTDSVKATISLIGSHPMSPRMSSEGSRLSPDNKLVTRRSMDVDSVRSPISSSPTRKFSGSGRRSMSSGRLDQRKKKTDSHSAEESKDTSVSTISGSPIQDPSASQILLGSDVFLGPTRQSTSNTQASLSSTRSDAARQQSRQRTQDELDRPEGHSLHTSHTLHNITKIGTFPLQQAGAFAGYVNRTGRRMSSKVASDAMGYVGKVSNMLKGGGKHYDDSNGLRTYEEDGVPDDEDEDIRGPNERFRAHFTLPGSEKLHATYFGYLMRVLPLYGKIYISDTSFCFRSLLPGTRTKLILPFNDIENVDKEKGFRFSYHGLVVVVRAHEELFFEFAKSSIRDDCAVTTLRSIDNSRLTHRDKLGPEPRAQPAERDELQVMEDITQRAFPHHPLSQVVPEHDAMSSCNVIAAGKIALSHKPAQSLRITCLTIGSRGDVQPYIALCKGLMAEGHHTRIATHAEFGDWVKGHGIDFAPIEGDPSRLMQLCIENGTFSLSFLREANASFRGWLDGLLQTAWEACQGSDVLVESPSAMAGIHIAEALGIPYFRAFTMPWTRTRAYPHAFIMPTNKMGGAYNYMTYVMFDNLFWRGTASQINRWRSAVLKLPHTTLEKLKPNQVPFLYCLSPSVVPPPLDYSDWIRVTGYWFLDEGTGWTPPQELVDFISRARADGKKIVYVGFGSIIVKDPDRMTQEVVEAVQKAGVRCILSKGWSERLRKDTGGTEATEASQSESAGTNDKDAKELEEHSKAHDESVKEQAEHAKKHHEHTKKCCRFGKNHDKDRKGLAEHVNAIDGDDKADEEHAKVGKEYAQSDDEHAHADEKHANADEEHAKVAATLPPDIFLIKSAPHDWLFKQVDAAAHHGGSGTLGASLRAGIPTIVRPFFGDQFFSATRVEDLGVGVFLKKWGAISFARALWRATNDERMIAKAREVGEKIRQEDGVQMAIQSVYRDMEYAKTLIKRRTGQSKSSGRSEGTVGGQEGDGPDSSAGAEKDDDEHENQEESWTFVGKDEHDPERTTIRLSAGLVNRNADGLQPNSSR